MAPAGAIPKSGLHAITGGDQDTSAAYLVGLFNSTPILDLAEALAPGSVSQEDIEALGLPQLPAGDTQQIEGAARALADLVHTLVTQTSTRWPDLLSALKGDPFLLSLPDRSWNPQTPPRTWGSLGSVGWVTLSVSNGARGPIASIDVTHDLFGPRLEISFRTGHASVEVPHESANSTLEAIKALVSGQDVNQGAGANLQDVPIAISPAATLEAYGADRADLQRQVNEYRAHRESIDSTLNRFI